MRDLICIVCPKGCRLKVDEANDYAVTGNRCPRGLAYGREELVNPTRVLTTTVRLTGGSLCRCPVRSNGAIPKDKIAQAMAILNAVTLQAPVRVGQIAVENLLDTGCDVIVTRDIDGTAF